MFFGIGIDGNVHEVSLFHEDNFPLWDDDPSWLRRLFRSAGMRAQDKFIF